jgi:hypothetical protein
MKQFEFGKLWNAPEIKWEATNQGDLASSLQSCFHNSDFSVDAKKWNCAQEMTIILNFHENLLKNNDYFSKKI